MDPEYYVDPSGAMFTREEVERVTQPPPWPDGATVCFLYPEELPTTEEAIRKEAYRDYPNVQHVFIPMSAEHWQLVERSPNRIQIARGTFI